MSPQRQSARSRIDPDPGKAALREIKALHRFFEDWFLRRCSNDGTTFARCSAALAAGFVQIDPEGREHRRAALLGMLKAAYGCHAGAPFTIRIKQARVRLTHHGLVLATYEEWQQLAERTTARRSTALFGPAPASPLGVEWLHLQETWMRH